MVTTVSEYTKIKTEIQMPTHIHSMPTPGPVMKHSSIH